MASRRRTITTAASRRSTPPPSNVVGPLRRSPRGLPRLNYRRKLFEGTRSTSSLGSTGRFPGTHACLKIQLKASLTKSAGETEYCGSGVFLLPEKAHRSSLHVRTREILVDVLGAGMDAEPIEPVREVPTFDYELYHRKQREHHRKMQKQSEKIDRFEAEHKVKQRARELAQARAGKRKVGEPSEPAKKDQPSSCSGELEAVKQEDSEEPNEGPSTYVRTPFTPPSPS